MAKRFWPVWLLVCHLHWTTPGSKRTNRFWSVRASSSRRKRTALSSFCQRPRLHSVSTRAWWPTASAIRIRVAGRRTAAWTTACWPARRVCFSESSTDQTTCSCSPSPPAFSASCWSAYWSSARSTSPYASASRRSRTSARKRWTYLLVRPTV